MLMRFAASGSPPTAKIQRPHWLRFRNTLATMATTPTTMAELGTGPR
jgi:hypothetical protein